MRLQLDRDSGVPVGTQLARRLRAAIERGELAPGDKLPSLRDAATEAGVNVNTVRAAYATLEADGIVVTEQGRGTFVARAGDRTDRRPTRQRQAPIQPEQPARHAPARTSSSSRAGVRVRWT
jgi:DNA-binding transcriptional regulator YhcF (GntR family)